MEVSVLVWLLAAACTQYTAASAAAHPADGYTAESAVSKATSPAAMLAVAASTAAASLATAPTRYNFPEFTAGYRSTAAAPAAAAPASYNAAAVAAGYNYPEFTGGYPARRAPAAGYSTAPGGGYSTAPAAGYGTGPAAGYGTGPAGLAPAAQQLTQSGPAQYNYGYSSGTSAKKEVRTPDGVVRGAYSYVDANGETQQVQYVSDATGFHVQGTNLPQTPAAGAAASS